MINYTILKDKTVNSVRYQLLERKDNIASDYAIGIPQFRKGMLSWELITEWETKRFTEKLFNNVGNIYDEDLDCCRGWHNKEGLRR